MRKLFILSFALLIAAVNYADAQELAERLASLPSVKKIEALESGRFSEKYLLYFEQPIDHKKPELGTFTQRVFVSNVSVDSSTVVVCEGYGAAYGMNGNNSSEISRLFNFNNVVIEHRFFLESTPAEKNWKYLTAEQQANDIHCIISELKTIYGNKWISTGSSKGGQNTIIHRSFFPDDVDISVPYVGPFCRGVEDGRHEPFLANVPGTAADRQKVQDIQIEFLKRRDRLEPMMDSLIKEKGYISRLPLKKIYDYTCLEFSFSFWQRGHNPDRIPSRTVSDKELFDYFTGISGVDYWVEESPTSPFFVMAAKELGYYGYDLKPFKKYLKIHSAKHYLRKIWLPREIRFVRFDKSLSKRLDNFIATTDCKILFVYGEYDPWSAARAEDNHGENVHIFIKPGGSHSSNISTLPEPMKSEALGILRSWIAE